MTPTFLKKEPLSKTIYPKLATVHSFFLILLWKIWLAWSCANASIYTVCFPKHHPQQSIAGDSHLISTQSHSPSIIGKKQSR